VYNEKDTVLQVLEQVKNVKLINNWSKQIIIVEDCSTDGTRKLLKNLSDPSLQIMYQPKNYGKGAAIRTAIPYCTSDYTIFQDADLEYHPKQFNKLLGEALRNDLDVVYGSRLLENKHYHRYKLNRWAVQVLSKITNLLYHTNFTDVATNYKLIRSSLLQSLDLTSNGFDIEFELSAKLSRKTQKISEIPIDYHPRSYAEGKKIRPSDTISGIIAIFRSLKS
jgi:glycosyltransferase involved in cell wall biosynthesis